MSYHRRKQRRELSQNISNSVLNAQSQKGEGHLLIRER